MRLAAGDVFAGYRVIRLLGAGGMGRVYLAEHPRLPRRDALKILDPVPGADAEFRLRFLREAELAARLEHPNVVSIYDRGAEGEMLWLAMRYVEGTDLAGLIRQGPGALPAHRAVRIIGAAARGLDAAHRAGLLHRDVKPANILVATGDDGSDIVRITDFGIARPLDSGTSVTATGSIAASLAYAAPEQFEGRPLGPRTDVYALGATLFETLTGRVPFAGRSMAAVLHAHLSEPPPRPSAVAAVPPALDAVIARAMAKDPAERFGSCGELAAAAEQALDPPPAVRGARPVAVPALILALAGVVIAAVILVATRPGDGVTGNAVAANTTTAPAAPPASSAPITPAAAAWGPAAYIVAAFPGLLPADPEGAGYQGMRCALNDDSGTWLHCPNTDPDRFSVNIHCAADRRPVTYRADRTGLADLHEEAWTRPSGTGTVRWASDSIAGFGLLDVAFDDPARNFCVVSASGGTGGRDVYDNWWAAAPV
ncbi:serine/threonine-protein kinase [Nocardia wallacei]|uniref:serine/threonine-protein kinase n=1 Tax=Nocardia wallacei TaxID=480035 RepID=UPI0024584112|nr:serine/threonine-protein kinase [Nocardia wallacei]